MKKQYDPGTSSAAAFILILAVIIVCIGVFSAAVRPVEQQRKAEQTADEVQMRLAETVFLMRGIAESAETRNLQFSTLLPKGTLTAKSDGYLQIAGHQIPLSSVSLETGRTTQGISAGGIWRKDGSDAAWILLPQTAYEPGTLSLELFVLDGNPTYGSTDAIPFRVTSTGSRTQTFSGNTISLTVVSEKAWVQNLWKTFFREIGFLYPKIDTKITSKSDRITTEFSIENESLTMELKESFFTISAGGNT